MTGCKWYPETQGKRAQVLRLSCLDGQGTPSAILRVDCSIRGDADFCVREHGLEMIVSFMIHDLFEPFVSATHTGMLPGMPTRWSRGRHRVRMEFPPGVLNCGQYYLRVGLGWVDDTTYDYHPDDGLSFELVANGRVEPHTIHSHGLLAIVPDFAVLDVPADNVALNSIY